MQFFSTIKRVPLKIGGLLHNLILQAENLGQLIVDQLKRWGIPSALNNAFIHIQALIELSGIPKLLTHLFKKTRRFFRRTDVILFMLCVITFIMFPSLDLTVSGLFYGGPVGHFIDKNAPFFKVTYYIFGTLLPFTLLAVLPFLIWRNFRQYKKGHSKRVRYLFLLMCLLIGPGLLVNTVIKDHGIGRERPSQIVKFGGHGTFTPAFAYSGQCNKNCSFVSGHAAMGFFFISLGWILASRRWFYFGFSLGVLIGFVRIAQGGHFLSDVVFAFWAVYLVTGLIGRLFNIKHPFSTRRRQTKILPAE